MVWDARVMLESLKEEQSFLLIPAEKEKVCPELPGIHLK